MIVGLVAFMLGASASVLVMVAGRWAAGLPFGARRLKDAMTPWGDGESPRAALVVARAAGGSVGWYLGAALVFAMATLATGHVIVDDASMRVRVAAGGPAERAASRDGERVVAVDDQPIATWDELRRAVAARGEEITRVTVERGQERIVLEARPIATPDGGAKIMVGPFVERRAVGLGEALAIGAVQPARVVAATARSIGRSFTGREPVEMTGPVGVANEVGRAGREEGAGTVLKLAALLASYVWPLIVIGSAVLAFARAARGGTRSDRPGDA